MFDNIQQIKNHTFVGNHASDHAAFTGIEQFVSCADHSIADKAEALRVMSDEGLGCGRDEHISDSDIVKHFLDSI